MSRQIVLTEVDGYGWLPTVVVNGKEVYRGEFEVFSLHAFDRADDALDRLGITMPRPVRSAS